MPHRLICIYKFSLIIAFFLPTQCYSQTNNAIKEDSAKGSTLFWKGISLVYDSPDSAISCFSKAQPLLKKTKQDFLYAASWNGLSLCYNLLEDIQATFPIAQKALEEVKKSVGDEHFLYIDAQINYAKSLRDKGQSHDAISLYQTIIKKAKHLYPEDLVTLATLYNNIGGIYTELGDYEECIRYFSQAVENQDEHLKESKAYEDTISFINFNINLANTYWRKKELSQALSKYKQIISFIPNRNSYTIATVKIDCYYDMAQIFLDQNINDSALISAIKADKIQRKDNPYRPQIYYDIIGEVHKRDKDYSSAYEAFAQAFALRKENLRYLPNHPSIARSYMDIGRLFFAKKDYDKALNYLNQSIQWLTDTTYLIDQTTGHLPPLDKIVNHDDAILPLYYKAKSHERLFTQERDKNELFIGLSAVELAIQIIQKMRNFFTDEESMIRLTDHSNQIFELAIELCIKLSENTNDDSFIEKALKFAEQNKSIALLNSTRTNSIKLDASLPDSVLLKEKEIINEISFYSQKVYTELQKPNANREQIKKWRKKIFLGEEQHRKFLIQLEHSFPRYYQLKYQDAHISFQEIRRNLESDTKVILEFFWGDSAVYAFAINSRGSRVFKLTNINIIKDDVSALMTLLKEPIHNINAAHNFGDISHRVFTNLLSPVFNEFPKTTNLIIIPDGPLCTLPFEVLIKTINNQETQNIARYYRSQLYLIKEVVISYDYSLALRYYKRHVPSPKINGVIGFGPQYSGELSLTGNQSQIERAVNLLNGESYLGSSATKKNFKESTSQYQIIHLAAHGIADKDRPLFAKILFSKEPDSSINPMLYAYEIYNLELTAELAVLSACEADVGNFQRGEGVFSLARAFKYAGCNSIISSKWQVEGNVAGKILESFYKHLKNGETKSRALFKAKRDFIAQASPDQLHPHFWATFTQIGDETPINVKPKTGVILVILLLTSSLFIGGYIFRKTIIPEAKGLRDGIGKQG